MFRFVFGILTCFSLFGISPFARADSLNIYIDADFSISQRAAEAIELGVQTALAEVGHQVGGVTLNVVRKDHRANSKRTLSNLRAFQKDPRAIAVVGGALSPPYLTHQQFINGNGILLLLPWSAAGPITRARPDQENWIFRLSVDDTKAGPFLVSRALTAAHCDRTALLLIDTGWGRANSSTMQAAFSAAGEDVPQVFMFSAGLGSASARSLAQTVALARPDCVIMLANADSGALLINELHQAIPDVKVISHWGILAGDFLQRIPAETRAEMELEVLQTCGLRVERDGSDILVNALEGASRGGTVFRNLADVPSSTGFVHGYDLTKVFLSALGEAAKSPDWPDASIEKRRSMVRGMLENLPAPVPGILKTYDPPFQPYASDRPDAHEALGLSDLCMAAFSEDGHLVLADSADQGH